MIPQEQLSFLTIAYIIMINKENKAFSYLNEYPLELINKIDIFRKISELPKDLCEVYCNKETSIQHRLSGFFDGYKIRFCSSLSEVENVDSKIKVVFCNGLSNDELKVPEGIYILGPKDSLEKSKDNCLSSIDKTTLITHLDRFYLDFDSEQKDVISELRETYSIDKSSNLIDSDIELNRSIYTEANILVLKSAKLSFSYENFRYECSEDEIFESINLLNYIRNDIAKNLSIPISLPPIEIVFSDFSTNLDFQINKGEYTQNALKNKGFSDPRVLEKAIKLALKNGFNETSEKNTYFDEAYNEKLLSETLIGLYSCSNLIPSAKIPISNSDVYGNLKDIGINDRKNNQRSLKIKFRALKDNINQKASGYFDYLKDHRPSEIKLVSNLPIEWSSHNGLPTMIAHNVSRLPISPGWLTTKCLIDTRNTFITMESLSGVLIVSSFKEDDIIKDDLSSKLEVFNRCGFGNSENQFKVKAKIVTPSNYDELVSALNNSKSPIVIFDLHGGHQENGGGVICLKDEVISVYDLIEEARIPPIVVLSSCDTGPIDRNHFSTANGFLYGGAKTVLASALPILSKEASTFIFRLMLRLQEYLPIIINRERKSIRWSSFISGMIRRTYYTEFIDYLIKENLATPDKKTHLNFLCGMHVDPLQEDFHSKIKSLLSKEINLDIDEIQRILDEDFVLPECLKYLQFGSPEQVIIGSPHQIKMQENIL